MLLARRLRTPPGERVLLALVAACAAMQLFNLALIGAFVLTYLPEYLQQLQYWQKFAYGLLLAVVMFVLPLVIVLLLVATLF